MRWSIKIARIAGIEVKIHITFLLFLAWLGFAYYQKGGANAAIAGVLFILALFGCVLLHEFPVVDEADRLLGVLTRDGLIAALKRHGPGASVVEFMRRDLPVVSTEDPFDKAFREMQECACPALPVVDRLGRFVGLITPENIGELMLVQSLRPRSGAPVWRTSPLRA